MATTAPESVNGITQSLSLREFCKTHGRMQVGSFSHTNEETGEIRRFQSCIFTNPETKARTFVGFAHKLGEISPSEIARQVDNLQVVTLESGSHVLCSKGANAWQDVII